MTTLQQHGGPEKRFQQIFNLLLPASREKQNGVRIAFNGRIRPSPDDVHQRMPDELHIQSGPVVDLRFERKNHQQFPAVLCQFPDIAVPPDPHLRTDVPHHRNSGLPHRFRKPEIESRIIDQDHLQRTPFFRFADQVQQNPDELQQILQHLHQTDHAEFAGIDQQFDSGLAHFDASHSADHHIRAAAFEFRGDACAVEIPRCLSRDDPDFLPCRIHFQLLPFLPFFLRRSVIGSAREGGHASACCESPHVH